MREPLRYHRNNVGGSLNLLDTTARRGVHRLVFSSSCTVYGAPEQVPTDATEIAIDDRREAEVRRLAERP